jgi:hypothetical protein
VQVKTKHQFHRDVYLPALKQRRRQRLQAVQYWATIVIPLAAMFATAFMVGNRWPF